MGSTRRHVTDEYKARAVELVINDGRTNADVARGIGVHEMTLGKWVKKASDVAEPLTARIKHRDNRVKHDDKRLTDNPGSRRMLAELRAEGDRVARERVAAA